MTWSPENPDRRQDAIKTLHRMIVTALENCASEAKIDPAAYPIIAQSIIDQVTQPHVTWALKELATPVRMA